MERLDRQYVCEAGHWTGLLKLARPVARPAACPHMSNGVPCRSGLTRIGEGAKTNPAG